MPYEVEAPDGECYEGNEMKLKAQLSSERGISYEEAHKLLQASTMQEPIRVGDCDVYYYQPHVGQVIRHMC